MGNKISQRKAKRDEFEAHGIVFNKKRWDLYPKAVRKQEHEMASTRKRLQNTKIGTIISKKRRENKLGKREKSSCGCCGACHSDSGDNNVEGVDAVTDDDNVIRTTKTEEHGTKGSLDQNGVSCPPVIPPAWHEYTTHIENIVMSGGGSKGYTFIGALKALADCGVLSRMRRVAGSSVGGICAGLVAIGCSPQEIADIFSVDNRWLFHDQSCTAFYCVPNIWKKFGVHPADRFYRIYGGHIQRKTGNPDITFKELYDLTGRELCIVVTNLNKMCAEYCHPKTTPDLPVRLAVRMTMSFPVLYQPVDCEINGVRSLYSDGGILDQFPIHVFDGEMLDMNHNTSTPTDGGEDFNPKTLGLYVIGETPLDYQIWRSLFGQEIPYHPTYVPNTRLTRKKLKSELDVGDSSKKLSPVEKQKAMAASLESVFAWPGAARHVNIEKFGDYLGATIEALLVQQRKLLVKPRDKVRTVPVNAGYIGTNDYQMEPGDREFMIRQGYECVRKFVVETLESANTPQTNGHSNSHINAINGYSNGKSRIGALHNRPVSMETQV